MYLITENWQSPRYPVALQRVVIMVLISALLEDIYNAVCDL